MYLYIYNNWSNGRSSSRHKNTDEWPPMSYATSFPSNSWCQQRTSQIRYQLILWNLRCWQSTSQKNQCQLCLFNLTMLTEKQTQIWQDQLSLFNLMMLTGYLPNQKRSAPSLQTWDADREPPKSDVSSFSSNLRCWQRTSQIRRGKLLLFKLEMLTENLPNQKMSAPSLQTQDADREPPKSEDVSSFSSNSRCWQRTSQIRRGQHILFILMMLTENLPNQKRSAHSLQPHDADREPDCHQTQWNRLSPDPVKQTVTRPSETDCHQNHWNRLSPEPLKQTVTRPSETDYHQNHWNRLSPEPLKQTVTRTTETDCHQDWCMADWPQISGDASSFSPVQTQPGW